MNIKLIIDKTTLEVECDDDQIIINKIIEENNKIKIEISKPDPEFINPWQS